VVEPEAFRLYSIASATPEGRPARTLRLVVGGLDYGSPRTPYSYERRRRGSASHFLRRMATEPRYRNKQLSLRIVPTPRFRLPADPDRPVVMFAAGSGVAPFHGFVADRQGSGSATDRLYLGMRTPEEFVEHAGFDAAAAAGRLAVFTAFSRADATARFDPGRGAHVIEPGPRRRVDEVVRADEHAAALWDLVRAEADGGRGAHVYVCGSTRFAVSVMDALTAVVARATGSDERAREFVRQLVADARVSLDVFTTYGGHAQQGPVHEVSELALRNTDEAGHWMAVSGRVYDVGEFIHLHIGGPHIVRNHTGLDATAAYRQVLHHVQPEVDAQLGMYEIGRLRRLRFGGRWGVVLTRDGLASMPLAELFASWVRLVYLVVGMENALAADFGFVTSTATRGEDPGELTPFKAQFVLETHRRYLISYLDGLIDDDLSRLWETTIGFCAPDLDVRSFRADAAALTGSADYRLVRNSVAHVKGLVQRADPGRRAQVEGLCRTYARADTDLLRAMKGALLGGVRAFEEHEADVAERASAALTGALSGALAAVGEFYRRLATETRALGVTDDMLPAEIVEEAVPPDAGIPGHGGPVAGAIGPSGS
jgi:sulfite reductase (NADPH) flavoprotein alpha-component